MGSRLHELQEQSTTDTVRFPVQCARQINVTYCIDEHNQTFLPCLLQENTLPIHDRIRYDHIMLTIFISAAVGNDTIFSILKLNITVCDKAASIVIDKSCNTLPSFLGGAITAGKWCNRPSVTFILSWTASL